MENKIVIDGIFKESVPILTKIIDAGFEAYFVGEVSRLFIKS